MLIEHVSIQNGKKALIGSENFHGAEVITMMYYVKRLFSTYILSNQSLIFSLQPYLKGTHIECYEDCF